MITLKKGDVTLEAISQAQVEALLADGFEEVKETKKPTKTEK